MLKMPEDFPYYIRPGGLVFDEPGDGTVYAVPRGLRVNGDLDLRGARLDGVPPCLVVTGTLDLRRCEGVARLPAIRVGGDLLCDRAVDCARVVVGGSIIKISML